MGFMKIVCSIQYFFFLREISDYGEFCLSSLLYFNMLLTCSLIFYHYIEERMGENDYICSQLQTILQFTQDFNVLDDPTTPNY